MLKRISNARFKFPVICCILFLSVLFLSSCHTTDIVDPTPEQISYRKMEDQDLLFFETKADKKVTVNGENYDLDCSNINIPPMLTVFRFDTVKLDYNNSAIVKHEKFYKLDSISYMKFKKFDPAKTLFATLGILVGTGVFLTVLIIATGGFRISFGGNGY